MSATTEATAEPQLRNNSLSFIETVGQSVANVAPTCTPAINIVVVAGMAGVGSWLAYLIATIGMMFVAGNIGILARRHPMAGSYFVYIGRTLGPFAGMLAGWSMIGAYIATAVAVINASDLFANAMFGSLGIASLMPVDWLFDPFLVAVVCYLAYRDIRISARIGLAMEGISLAVITLITAIVLIRHGATIQSAQLNFARLPVGGVMSALAFAVFSFVGFESAATLAKESRDPTRMIPRAVIVSAGLAGLFFVVICFAMVLAVHDNVDVIAKSDSPFEEITRRAGLTWAAAVVYASALISGIACALACINAVSRMIFSMGRYEFLHRSMGKIHPYHQTPYHAIAAACVLVAILCLLLTRLSDVEALGTSGTIGTFGFLVVYLLICVVAPMDLRQHGLLRSRHAGIGAIGALLMVFVIGASLYPVPPFPYNLLPYIFAAYLAFGAVLYTARASRISPELLSMQRDLEA